MKSLNEIEQVKADKELVILHKRVLKNYLITQTIFAHDQIQKVMQLYDVNISFKNIRGYYNHHVRILLTALIIGRLDEIYQPDKLEK